MKRESTELPIWKWHFSIFPVIGILVATSILWMAKEKNESLATEESILTWFLVGAVSSVALILTIKKRKRDVSLKVDIQPVERPRSNQSMEEQPIQPPRD